jgi:hypothetical protein
VNSKRIFPPFGAGEKEKKMKRLFSGDRLGVFFASVLWILFLLGYAGCIWLDKTENQWEKLSSVERAMRLDLEFLRMLGDLKDSVDAQYQAYVEAGDQEGIDFIEQEVTPLVANVEAAVSAYHELVMQWSETGIPPSEIEMAAQAVVEALDFVEMKLLEHALSKYEAATISWVGSSDSETFRRYQLAEAILYMNALGR